MKITNHNNLPDAILQAIRNDSYDPGESDITVTQLVSPPRQRVLKKRHESEIEIDASEMIWQLLGQSIHAILERADVALTESRLYKDVASWKIGGRYDRIILNKGLMQDYKVTSVWSILEGPKPEWVEQLNFLRVLAHENGIEINKLQIVAILRDWSMRKARYETSYPKDQTVTLDVELWPLEVAEKRLEERVVAHQRAEKNLPLCTSEERWEKATVYAVKTRNRKRAIKLHESATSAALHANQIKNAYVETRPGEATRCEDYCPVAQFCSQYQGTQS